jgi:hypothetical protein
MLNWYYQRIKYLSFILKYNAAENSSRGLTACEFVDILLYAQFLHMLNRLINRKNVNDFDATSMLL